MVCGYDDVKGQETLDRVKSCPADNSIPHNDVDFSTKVLHSNSQ